MKEANQSGARLEVACAELGLTARTYRRWLKQETLKDKRQGSRAKPLQALSIEEEKAILEICLRPEYGDLPPTKIVPLLADQGIYLASESTFYRILRKYRLLAHRSLSRPRTPRKRPKVLIAKAPNEVFTWDITYLPTVIRGKFFYLYLFVDVFSRKVVGWQVHTEERSELASELLKDIVLREQIEKNKLTVHSDNGAPMRGSTMLATMYTLGIESSYSRARVSNDNPYSESLFKTLKYHPCYPHEPFETLESARIWVERFIQWYNREHLHSGINFVTPESRHQRKDKEILDRRRKLYKSARDKNPLRWSGEIRSWEYCEQVFLNPETDLKEAI